MSARASPRDDGRGRLRQRRPPHRRLGPRDAHVGLSLIVAATGTLGPAPDRRARGSAQQRPARRLTQAPERLTTPRHPASGYPEFASALLHQRRFEPPHNPRREIGSPVLNPPKPAATDHCDAAALQEASTAPRRALPGSDGGTLAVSTTRISLISSLLRSSSARAAVVRPACPPHSFWLTYRTRPADFTDGG
jgi:hypothetical protein